MQAFNLRAAARTRLERDIAAFERRGGKVERIGPTQFFKPRGELAAEYAAKRELGLKRGRITQARTRAQGRASS